VLRVQTEAIGFFEHAPQCDKVLVDGRLGIADFGHVAAELAGMLVAQVVPGEFCGYIDFSVREDVSKVVKRGRLCAPAAGAERVQVGLSGGGQVGVELQLLILEGEEGLFSLVWHGAPFGNIILVRNYNPGSVGCSFRAVLPLNLDG